MEVTAVVAAETETESFSQGDGTHWVPVTYTTVMGLRAKGEDVNSPNLPANMLVSVAETEHKAFVVERGLKYVIGTGQIEVLNGDVTLDVVVLFAQLSDSDMVEHRLTFDTGIVVKFEDNA